VADLLLTVSTLSIFFNFPSKYYRTPKGTWWWNKCEMGVKLTCQWRELRSPEKLLVSRAKLLLSLQINAKFIGELQTFCVQMRSFLRELENGKALTIFFLPSDHVPSL